MTLTEGVGDAEAEGVGEGDDVNEADGDASGPTVGVGVGVGFGVGVGVTGGTTRNAQFWEQSLLKPKSLSVMVTDFSWMPLVLNHTVGEPCPLMISPAETDQTYFGLTPGLPPFHSAVELATSPASTD